MNLTDIYVYRITHIDNISHILKYGITHKNSPNANSEYRNIGDISLINTRDNRTIYVDNGDFEFEANTTQIVLGDYIPFYFGIRMPMLYVAQHGGNFVEQATPASEIIYLACSLNKIILRGLNFYFTDGHATDGMTSFYDKTKINELVDIIDWSAVKSYYWGGNENLNVKRKKQAELLVAQDLAPELITGIVCYNQAAKTKLIVNGADESIVKVYPKAYY
ncbi:MAG: DUF4433 domain-containing protein [Perlabentimonas sp.]